ncbi:transposase [Bacillus haynesii]|nr:transposase [Bacillus haynesii]
MNQKNGRKSHRTRKTVFDILGAVYLCHKKVT